MIILRRNSYLWFHDSVTNKIIGCISFFLSNINFMYTINCNFIFVYDFGVIFVLFIYLMYEFILYFSHSNDFKNYIM